MPMFKQLITLIFLTILYAPSLYADKKIFDNKYENSIAKVTNNCSEINLSDCFESVTGYRYVVRLSWRPYKVGASKYPTCSGVLISSNLVLTAAHCLSWNDTPDNNINNMIVDFMYEGSKWESIPSFVSKYGGEWPDDSYGIEEVIEYGFDPDKNIDYAIIKLRWEMPSGDSSVTEQEYQQILNWYGSNFDEFYGKVYISEISPTANNPISIIQHPLINIDAPNSIQSTQQRSTGYFTSDIVSTPRFSHNAPTYYGSSGSGILDTNDRLIGIHIGGINFTDGTYENYGISISEIAQVSGIISSLLNPN